MTLPISYQRPRVWQNEQMKELQRFFDAYFAREMELTEVLDAGAGVQLPLDIPLHVRLTSLDIDEGNLSRNMNADRKIVGDLQLYDFAENSFDAIICWYVLEHVADPDAVLARLATAVRPGGLIVISVPYIWSFKGMITRFTPHTFHLWVYRRLGGLGGGTDTVPYRTYLRGVLAPRRLDSIARSNRLGTIYSTLYNEQPEDALPASLRALWRALGKAARVATFNRYDPLTSEYIVVFRNEETVT